MTFISFFNHVLLRQPCKGQAITATACIRRAATRATTTEIRPRQSNRTQPGRLRGVFYQQIRRNADARVTSRQLEFTITSTSLLLLWLPKKGGPFNQIWETVRDLQVLIRILQVPHLKHLPLGLHLGGRYCKWA